MREFYETSYANVHRAVYVLGERSTAGYEGAREKVRALLNARSTREIVFTRNGTEGLNLVAYAWGLDNLGPGDVAVATELEHHSNFVPWQYIAKRTGASSPSSRSTRAASSSSRRSRRSRSAAASSSSRARSSRTRSARSTRSRSSRPGRTSATRSWSSTPARLRRTGRSTCRRSAATSSPSRATRCSARAVSAVVWGRQELLQAHVAVRARRLDDPEGHARRDDLGRPALQVRGRDAADRGGLRARDRDRLPERRRPRRRSSATSTSSPSTRWAGWPSSRTCVSSARRPTGAAGSSRSRSRASIRTTSRRSSTPRASPSGRGTTARSRSWITSASSATTRASFYLYTVPRGDRPAGRRARQGPRDLRLSAGER